MPDITNHANLAAQTPSGLIEAAESILPLFSDSDLSRLDAIIAAERERRRSLHKQEVMQNIKAMAVEAGLLPEEINALFTSLLSGSSSISGYQANEEQANEEVAVDGGLKAGQGEEGVAEGNVDVDEPPPIVESLATVGIDGGLQADNADVPPQQTTTPVPVAKRSPSKKDAGQQQSSQPPTVKTGRSAKKDNARKGDKKKNKEGILVPMESDMPSNEEEKGLVVYRDPNNPSYTWNGKGIIPRWVTVLIENGATLESLVAIPAKASGESSELDAVINVP